MKITAHIVPKGQRRARHGVVKGFSRTYKDSKQEQEEQALMAVLAGCVPKNALQGPLLLGIKAFLPVPSSKPKKWKEGARTGHIRPVTKPDLDNLIKHAKDCLTMLRFWEDDRQVVGYLPHTGKYYSVQPRWEIEIVPLHPELYKD